LANDFFREYAGGFDVGWIVEQDEGLKRRVGSRPFDGALFSAGGVKGEHGGVKKRSAPIGVEAAAVLVFIGVVLIGALREI
jgi:hypothetical protein